MESSKLMAFSASRDASASSTADFLRIDSGSNARDDLDRNAYAERNTGLDQGHRPAVEAESSSSTLLNAEITLLDAAGAVTPISDGEREPPRMARRTVDDVWREIVAGKKSEKQPKEEMMTLEDFLAKADLAEEKKAANEETRSTMEVKEEGLSGGIYSYESGSSVMGSGLGLDFGGIGRGKGRSLSLLEPLDRAAQQRQKRMIKNRESAARSRERKQAYQVELESMAVRLEEENEQLLKEKEEWTKKRLKQLRENVIPVVEKRKPLQLKKVRSMQW